MQLRNNTAPPSSSCRSARARQRNSSSDSRRRRAASTTTTTTAALPPAAAAAQAADAAADPGRREVLAASAVSGLTELLRAAGVGRGRVSAAAAAAPRNAPLAPGDADGLLERLRGEFERAYFVTGVVDASIYDPACEFSDPTVSFRGLELYRRNLQLLTPFLVAPEVELLSLRRLPDDDGGSIEGGGRADSAAGASTSAGATAQHQQQQQQQPPPPPRLQATWRLQTGVALPWRPRVDVLGSTTYFLTRDANRIARHKEAWNVSGSEAVAQLLRPGGGGGGGAD